MAEEVILSRVNLCSSCSLEKENAELKEEVIHIEGKLNACGSMYTQAIKNYKTKIKKLEEQIENMKNFYNCSHSSRALCPNEHKCNGCKDWELAE